MAEVLKVLGETKGAPQRCHPALLTKLRGEFESGGRQAKITRKPLRRWVIRRFLLQKKSGDLLKALQDMKVIPGEAEDA